MDINCTLASNNGISVYALKHVFLREVIDEGFTKNTTLHELEERILRKKGQHTICPRDKRLGAAYVDCLFHIDHVGPANLYLSCTWSYSIGDVVDSVVSHCEERKSNEKRTYIWFDCTCVNQHRVYETRKKGNMLKPEIIQKIFETNMSSCENAVILMSPWEKPKSFSRIWLVYELFILTKTCSGQNVIMPPREIQSMFGHFQQSIGNCNLLFRYFVDLADMVKHAEATALEDKECIQKLIKGNEDGVNYHEVNMIANELIRNFVKHTFASKTNEWIKDAEQILDDEYLISASKLHAANYESNDLIKPNDEMDNEIVNPNGVSVHYLKHVFLKEIKDFNFSENSTIYEIEDFESQSYGVIRSKGRNVTCPHDGKTGAAYVDCLNGANDVGPAKFMLSYCWGNTASDIVNSLEEFCRNNNLDPKRTYIWICCLCVNQHRVKEYVPVEKFYETFRSHVLKIGHVISLMSPWNDPIYLKRVWCVFELFTAYENGCEISIIMPNRERKDMITKIGDTNALYHALVGGKVEDAIATYVQDKDHIMEIVQRGPGGFETLNKVVNGKFRDWIKATVVEELDKWMTSAEKKFLEEYVF